MHFDLYSDLHDNWWSKDKLLNYKGLGHGEIARAMPSTSKSSSSSRHTHKKKMQ